MQITNGRMTAGKVLAGFAAAAVAVVLWLMKFVEVNGVLLGCGHEIRYSLVV